MPSAVDVGRSQRSVRARARRAPEAGIWALAGVLLGFLLVHRHSGSSPSGGVLHGVAEDAAMMALMMMPLAGRSALLLAQRSLRSRWVRSVAEHVAGFAAVWFAYGVAAAVAVRLLTAAVGGTVVLVVLLLGAAVWQLSRARRRRIRRCGRLRTAAPAGWRADVGSALAGGQQALSCVATCWASMLAMVAAPHPAVMGTVLAASLSEWAPGPNPLGSARRRRPAVVYTVLAVGTLLVAVAKLGVPGSSL